MVWWGGWKPCSVSHQYRSHMTYQRDLDCKNEGGGNSNLAGNFTWLCSEKWLITSPGGELENAALA